MTTEYIRPLVAALAQGRRIIIEHGSVAKIVCMHPRDGMLITIDSLLVRFEILHEQHALVTYP